MSVGIEQSVHTNVSRPMYRVFSILHTPNGSGMAYGGNRYMSKHMCITTDLILGSDDTMEAQQKQKVVHLVAATYLWVVHRMHHEQYRSRDRDMARSSGTSPVNKTM